MIQGDTWTWKDYQINPKPFYSKKNGLVDLFYAHPTMLPQETLVVKLHTVTEGDEESKRRFAREIALLREFSDQKVQGFVEIRAIIGEQVTHGGKVYQYGYVMPEYECLSDYLKDGSKLSEKQAVGFMLSVARTLSTMHQPSEIRSSLTHRDIKPHNLFLDKHGNILVGDLGIAKTHHEGQDVETLLTRMPADIGTLCYMAPEQLKQEHRSRLEWTIGPWTDVHGIGATLFHLLTGRPPYPRHPPEDKCAVENEARRDLRDEHPAFLLKSITQGLTESIEAVVDKCLKKNPKDRYQNCDELAVQLQLIADGLPSTEPGISRRERLTRNLHSHLIKNRDLYLKIASVTAGILLLIVIAAFFGIFLQWQEIAVKDQNLDSTQKENGRLSENTTFLAAKVQEESIRANWQEDAVHSLTEIAKRLLYDTSVVSHTDGGLSRACRERRARSTLVRIC